MSQSRPLVISADETLLDDLLRLVAAAGAESDVSADVAGARASWGRASLVLVDIRQSAVLVRARLPRRDGVVLVSGGEPGPDVWRIAVELGAEHVAVLPVAESWLVDRIADSVEEIGVGGHVVGVIGGRGGAGASVLAASLAVNAAATAARSMLVDLDPLGGGIDLVLGGEATTGLRWPGLAEAAGRLSHAALAEALPRPHDVALLTFDRAVADDLDPATVRAVIQAGRRSGGVVVVDLPRRLDRSAAEACELADQVLVVVPAEVRACLAANAVVASVARHCLSLSVVVRTSSAGLPLDAVLDSVGLPLAGVLAREPGLEPALDRGDPPGLKARGPLATLCRELLDDVRGVPGRRAA